MIIHHTQIFLSILQWYSSHHLYFLRSFISVNIKQCSYIAISIYSMIRVPLIIWHFNAYKKSVFFQYYLMFIFRNIYIKIETNNGIITIMNKSCTYNFVSSNYDCDLMIFKGNISCYILLLKSPLTLENTKFIAGKLSLIVSLVLYPPTRHYEP